LFHTPREFSHVGWGRSPILEGVAGEDGGIYTVLSGVANHFIQAGQKIYHALMQSRLGIGATIVLHANMDVSKV